MGVMHVDQINPGMESITQRRPRMVGKGTRTERIDGVDSIGAQPCPLALSEAPVGRAAGESVHRIVLLENSWSVCAKDFHKVKVAR
jgi:hypothetical protein